MTLDYKSGITILSTNAPRYQINKDRAEEYSRLADEPLHWSYAVDMASGQVLQMEDFNKEAKIKWLQYHDRDTGDLPGVLPLAIGMPVALTEHIDRSSKQLLRGTVGRVRFLEWKDGAKQPSLVVVKFCHGKP